MIHVPLTDELQQEAQHRADNMPFIHGSRRPPSEASIVGCYGELVVERFLTENGVPFRADYDKFHDLVFPNGKTVEVRTKDRNVAPRYDYECSIPANNYDKQYANMFMFVSIRRIDNRFHTKAEHYSDAYILGVMSRKRFDDVKVLWDKGSSNSSNNWTSSNPCYNVYINQLMPPEEAVKRWKAIFV